MAKHSYHSFSNSAIIALFCAALFVCLPEIANSQVINIGKQATENKNINRPKKGMSQSLVVKLFGKPRTATKPIGAPPISRWQYKHFTVYFEGNYVIHSVLKRAYPSNSHPTSSP